jgi:hypothetical protein
MGLAPSPRGICIIAEYRTIKVTSHMQYSIPCEIAVIPQSDCGSGALSTTSDVISHLQARPPVCRLRVVLWLRASLALFRFPFYFPFHLSPFSFSPTSFPSSPHPIHQSFFLQPRF